ncbi:hypothetical protein PBRA_007145 [Plasmodiophora brassicae]|nr:hypothetical protein PBRA_007145 [Plasmodiophora brassicae]
MRERVRQVTIGAIALEVCAARAQANAFDGLAVQVGAALGTPDDDNAAVRPDRVMRLDGTGRLRACDPVSDAIANVHDALTQDRSADGLPPGTTLPTSSVVDDFCKAIQGETSRIQASDRGDAPVDDVEGPGEEQPLTLQVLMQQSRSAHIDRFSKTLRALNRAADVESQLEGGGGACSTVVAKRAALECLRKHVSRLESELAAAEENHRVLTECDTTIARLDGEKRDLQQALMSVIKGNRQMRSDLLALFRQCSDRDRGLLDERVSTLAQAVERMAQSMQVEMKALLGIVDGIQWRRCAPGWKVVAEALQLRPSHTPEPLALLMAIANVHDRRGMFLLEKRIDGGARDRAEPVQVSTVDDIRKEFEEYREFVQHKVVDKTLADISGRLCQANKLADLHEQLLREWWEQPAQFTVPEEQRSGLNIKQWIERRRKLIDKLRDQRLTLGAS